VCPVPSRERTIHLSADSIWFSKKSADPIPMRRIRFNGLPDRCQNKWTDVLAGAYVHYGPVLTSRQSPIRLQTTQIRVIRPSSTAIKARWQWQSAQVSAVSFTSLRASWETPFPSHSPGRCQVNNRGAWLAACPQPLLSTRAAGSSPLHSDAASVVPPSIPLTLLQW